MTSTSNLGQRDAANAMEKTESAAVRPLEDRYELERGEVFLSGTQALVRLMLDQKRHDARAGLRTGTFVTGYPGSPLGGIDGALRSAAPLLKKYDVRHVPAQNEELAATSLMGTQMLDEHPHSRYDGVVAFWYGKGPGVDRATDALKHGNFAGTSQHGAVVILSGEDHEAKSSTVPYQQEWSFEHIGMPVLFPASVAEFLEFGRHAVALSRFSGCWVSLKLVGPLCDGGETVCLDPEQPQIRLPAIEIDGQPFRKSVNFRFFPVRSVATERTLYYDRHAAVRAYARANRLDRIMVRSDSDRIGIAAAGKTYTDVVQALRELGFDAAKLQAAGIRLLKIGMVCPLEPEIILEFAAGLNDVIVVEEKRDFLERQLGRILCNLDTKIRICGKRDWQERPLFPIQGGMDHDLIAERLGRVLSEQLSMPLPGNTHLQQLDTIGKRPAAEHPKRVPNFCSGCPHNIGTRLAPGQIAWGSPGCHIFAALMSEPTRRIEAVTQYGGEGLPWIGLSPYTDRPHIVQNVGDGSLFHSSYLNIRYAVETGVSMTFKILYNGAIANTGGQTPVAARSIPQLATLLATEGVAQIAIITRNPADYARSALPAIAEVLEPPAMEATLVKFAATKGVTIVVYDGQCANERRRLQKRGVLPAPTHYTVVHEDVCEDCGHCGEMANCMSLQKIQTEFGRKTQIHQSSCNQDQTCLEGDCPSFVTVRTRSGRGMRRPVPPSLESTLPEPTRPALEKAYHIYIPGLGGTGVITANAILAQAATIDGHYALSYDQTGAAQKWGAVLSSLIVARNRQDVAANHVGAGQADLYLALDLFAAAEPGNLMRCQSARTAAVINASLLPSGEMIRNVRLVISPERMVDSVRQVSVPQKTLVLDARSAAEALFGDYMMINIIAIGAAYQAGLLPISADAIEQAIRLNNVAVSQNITAFRAGRLAVHDRAKFEQLTSQPYRALADRKSDLRRRPSPARTQARDRLMHSLTLDEETREMVALRVEDLCAYQNAAYAARYAAVVREVAERERAMRGASAPMALTRAVARNLHRLMAYKDEYEVARLLTQETFLENLRSGFDGDGDADIYYNLQPPLLRYFGMKRKIACGAWIGPLLKLLAAARGLRGSALDPFGHAPVRREERRLIEWYVDLIRRTLSSLTPERLALAEAIADLPADIRGYEEIKLRRVPAAVERGEALLQEMSAQPAPERAVA